MGDIEEFTATVIRHYVMALLWSESCNGTIVECDHVGMTGEDAHNCDRSFMDLNYDMDDLTPAALEEITVDVTDFVRANWADLQGLDPEQTGHDFLLTRNGHGVGFWDRDLGELGERLTEASRPYGTMSAYGTEDGKVGVQG
jgi:hypothetical protein